MSNPRRPTPAGPDQSWERPEPESARGSVAGRGASRRTLLSGVAGVIGAAGLGACSPGSPGSPPASAGAGSGSFSGPAVTPGFATSTATTTTTGPTAGTSTTATASAPGVLSTNGPDLRTGPPGGARVALTFHGAGAVDLTSKVLQIAAAQGARLTVFAVGQWLSANPQLGRAVVAAGHDLGNHTWSHQAMRSLTAAQADLEVRRGADAVAAVRGTAGLLFRPSGTPSSTATIRSAALASGYHRCISYDVDPSDYLDPGAAAVRDRTLRTVRAGSIVSLHLGHPGTVEALPGILDGLRQRGLTTVTVTQLVEGA